MRPHRPRRSTLLTTLVLVTTLMAVACSTGSDGAVPATTTEAPTTTTLPPSTTTTITSTPARKVLLLGDSTMVDASPAITAMFEATGAEVAMGAGPGFGLTRIGVSKNTSTFRTDWPRVLREEKPDLVVVMLGAWDTAYLEQNGSLAYSKVVKEATDILLSRGAKVVFMAMPPGGEAGDRPTDYVFELMAGMYPGQVFYVDYEGVLHGPDGGYPITTPGPDGATLHLRKEDGWHFCPDGAERVAAELDRLLVVHGLTTPAGDAWRQGSWRRSNYYDYPVCSA
jgi:hypothetical protein